MNLVTVGINFRTAPMELRESISFRPSDVTAILQQMLRDLPQTELVLLSTCNRTELYAAGPDAKLDQDELLRLLAAAGGGVQTSDLAKYSYCKKQQDAVAHLMTVASSLDSMIVGETEIRGQLKEAYQLALAAETVGKVLNPLFQHVFRVSKRVHSETDISRGRVSVASIAVELAERIFGCLSTKTVMVVGAGEVSEQTLKTLVGKGVKETFVLNRSLERGRALADNYGGTAVPFARLDDYLLRADMIISSTGAPHCVIRADAVKKAVSARHGRPIFLIDLALPRDIEDEAGSLQNVYLYNLDDLQSIAAENLAKRQDAMTKAQGIIAEGVRQMAVSLHLSRLGIGEVMRQLDDTVRDIEEAELKRAFAKDRVGSLGDRCDGCQDEMRNMLHRALSKLVDAPKKAIRLAVQNGSWDECASAVQQLFGIDHSNDNEDDK